MENETKILPTSTMPMIVTTKRGDSVLHRIVTEADIRKEAYYLWEKAGRVGSSEEYWYKAEERIRNILLSDSSAK
jgi:hypothetical protein